MGRGGKGEKEKRDEKGRRRSHTMTSPPSYATTSWSSVASPQCQGQHEVVGVEVGGVHGVSGCWRWNFSTTAVWTSVWGSHMLSKFDQPRNLLTLKDSPYYLAF